jgi:hypothetical protein
LARSPSIFFDLRHQSGFRFWISLDPFALSRVAGRATLFHPILLPVSTQWSGNCQDDNLAQTYKLHYRSDFSTTEPQKTETKSNSKSLYFTFLRFFFFFHCFFSVKQSFSKRNELHCRSDLYTTKPQMEKLSKCLRRKPLCLSSFCRSSGRWVRSLGRSFFSGGGIKASACLHNGYRSKEPPHTQLWRHL